MSEHTAENDVRTLATLAQKWIDEARDLRDSHGGAPNDFIRGKAASLSMCGAILASVIPSGEGQR